MPSGEHARPWVPRWLLVITGAAAGLYFVFLLRGVLTPLFAAMLLAYLFDPVVDRLERWRIPRGLAITALLGAFLLALTVVLLLVVPLAVREASDFFRALPHRVDVAWRHLEPWLVAQGLAPPTSFDELRRSLGSNVGDVSQRLAAGVGDVATWVASSTASVLSTLVTLLMIPVLTFYVLYDFDRLRIAVVDLIPWSHRALVLEIAADIDAVIAQFIRGQLVVMALLALAYSIAYSVVGVPLAVPIGLLAGAVSFIPHVGGAFALGTALLSCFLVGTSWLQVGLVVGVHLAIQWTEGFVVTPRIMADQVGLPAVWVILALLGFGELFGFMGVVIAVPAAAVIKTLLVRAVRAYKESALYGTDPVGAPGGSVPALDPESLAAAIGARRSVAAPPLDASGGSTDSPASAPPAVGDSEGGGTEQGVETGDPTPVDGDPGPRSPRSRP